MEPDTDWQIRRAFRERERVARRKLLTKIAIVVFLAVVTTVAVRAAVMRVATVTEEASHPKRH